MVRSNKFAGSSKGGGNADTAPADEGGEDCEQC